MSRPNRIKRAVGVRFVGVPRKLAFTAVIVFTFLLLVEAGLTLVEPLYLVRLQNRADPQGHTLAVASGLDLAATVRHNMLRNVLTYATAK